MKPGDPYYALYTREVLPDEIDEDPVEAPSFAQTAYLAYQQAFREFESLTGTVDFLDTVARIKAALSRPVETQGNRRALSRARPWEPCSDNVGIRAKEPAPDEGLVERLAHIVARNCGAQWGACVLIARAVLAEIAPVDLRVELATTKSDLRAKCERVADLEAELARERELHDQRVEVSRNRGRDIVKLQSDLATVTRERDELAGELAETEALVRSRTAVGDSLTRELAEAREELRLQHYIVEYCREHHARRFESTLKALDAHRAKTSDPSASPAKAESGAGEQASGTTATVGSELLHHGLFIPVSYETAPRLTKGVRYRVVDTTFAGENERWQLGHEFEASGTERLWAFAPYSTQGGWYEIGTGFGLQRVARVETEKAQKTGLRADNGAVLSPIDGSATRAPQATLDALAHDGGGERSGPADEHPIANLLRAQRESAGQPEAKAEAPLLGPHAATVADLEKVVGRVDRNVQRVLEDTAELLQEIRAERAGRVKA